MLGWISLTELVMTTYDDDDDDNQLFFAANKNFRIAQLNLLF